jgi:hypothetical protein
MLHLISLRVVWREVGWRGHSASVSATLGAVDHSLRSHEEASYLKHPRHGIGLATTPRVRGVELVSIWVRPRVRVVRMGWMLRRVVILVLAVVDLLPLVLQRGVSLLRLRLVGTGLEFYIGRRLHGD